MDQVLRETHEISPEIQGRLTRAGGTNQYGEPNYRIVWGWSRLGWIGGWWTIYDTQGNETGHVFEMRQEPKWLPPWDRWLLEAWRPAEWFGSPWLWKMQTTEYAYGNTGPSLESLGPYPHRGDYIPVTTIDIACRKCWADAGEAGKTDQEKARILGTCMDREFLQVDNRVADTLARMLRRNSEANYWEIRRQVQAQRDFEAKISAELDQQMMQRAGEVTLTKPQLEKIERITAPAIERQLARTARRFHDMTPEQRKLALGRAGRATSFDPQKWVN